jgi:hypothetical protein
MRNCRESAVAVGAAVLMAGLLLSGCAAAPRTAPEPPTPTTATTPDYDEAENTWFASAPQSEEFAAADGSAELPDIPSDPPTDLADEMELPELKGDNSIEMDPASDDSAVAADIDPCSLVPLEDWGTWLGADDATAAVIEPGEECLYWNPADLTRLSVSLHQEAGGNVLPEADRAAAENLLQFGDSVFVLEAYPTPYGTTVFADNSRGSVVVTIYSRDSSKTDDEIKTAAGTVLTTAMRAVG